MSRLSLLLATSALALSLPALAASNCTARDFSFGDASVGWKQRPLSKLKSDTRYQVKTDGKSSILHASADNSASLYATLLPTPLPVPASISWRWKTDALIPGADNRDKSREDAPLRVIVAFDGDRATLPQAEQKRYRRAEALFGQAPPYAILMYIWSNKGPLNSVITSAHTSQVKMIPVAAGSAGLGQWQTLKRNLAADYQRAFGAAPGPVLGVAVMTDTDNTDAKAEADYADIRFECGG